MANNFVGEKIGRMCSDKNISIATLSERSGLSESQIDVILNTDTVPSLASLLKIARALGVRLGTFLDDSEHLGPIVHTNNEQQEPASFSSQLSVANSHLDFFALASGKTGRNMEPFVIDINPSTEDDPIYSTHEGEEFIYVLEGSVKISYGKDSHILHKGESIYYDSIVPHLVSSGNASPAKIVAVVYSPA